jgi:hypothetical protein
MDAEQPLRETTPCPICGKLRYEWGHSGPMLKFFEATDSWFPTSHMVVARLCQDCGNVQLFKKIYHYRKIDETWPK